MIPGQKGGRKIASVSLETHNQILEKTERIQDPFQIAGK